MQRLISTLTIIALMGSSGAQAATDAGLSFHNGSRTSAPRAAIGAKASVTIQLGSREAARASDKVRLGVSAGPMMTTPGRSFVAGEKKGSAGLATFVLKPGYSSTLSIAGQPVLRSYTRLGAADADAQEDGTTKQKKKQSTGDKVAWVAAVAGGVMVVLVGVAAIVLMSDCYECGD